jgi:hypothetical protein
MKTLFTAALLSLVPAFAFAQHEGAETGNGGDGILEGTHMYLLDFVEAGVQSNPYMNPDVTADPADVARLRAALAGLETPDAQGNPNAAVPCELVARKVAEIRALDPVLAEALLATISLYDWRMVDVEFVDIRDERTYLSIDRAQFVQLAVRAHRTIRVYRHA